MRLLLLAFMLGLIGWRVRSAFMVRKSQTRGCWKCGGAGRLATGPRCWACYGKGWGLK